MRALPRAGPLTGREARPREPHEGGQQREGGEHGDRHRDSAADAHDRQERDADDEQARKRDDDCAAREHDGASRGTRRDTRRLRRVHAERQLCAVPRQDEQGVVDADREPDHEREQRRGARDGGRGRHKEDAAHRHGNPEQGADDGHSGRAHGAERHEQNDARDADADRLDDGDAGHLVGEDLPGELDPRIPIVARGDHRVEGLVGDLGLLTDERRLDDRDRSVVADLVVGELVERSEHLVDAIERGEVGSDRVDLCAHVGVVNPRPLGGHDDRLHARARNLGEQLAQLVERLLRLGAGDGEGVIG